MSYTGKGNDSQVYTMVSGEPKWAASAAGGGLGVTAAQNLALNADFTSVQLATAAGNRIVNVIGSTTEGANILIAASGLSLQILNDAQVDLQNFRFLWSAQANSNVYGHGSIRHSKATNDPVFDFDGNSGRLRVEGLQIVNNSSGTVPLTNGTNGRFDNCNFVGDGILDGTRNSITSSDFLLNLVVISGALDNIFSSCQLNGVIIDNGSGTLISDLISY